MYRCVYSSGVVVLAGSGVWQVYAVCVCLDCESSSGMFDGHEFNLSMLVRVWMGSGCGRLCDCGVCVCASLCVLAVCGRTNWSNWSVIGLVDMSCGVSKTV